MELCSIGEVAKQLDCSVSAVRYWQMKTAGISDYRVSKPGGWMQAFTQDDVNKIRTIMQHGKTGGTANE